MQAAPNPRRQVRQADQQRRYRAVGHRHPHHRRQGLAGRPRHGGGGQGRLRREMPRAVTARTAKGGPVFGTMVGGIGSFKTTTRVLTPGSMYPYAPILFDYIRRAMPMDHPQSLTTNEVYAVSAYLLNLNGIIPANAVMDQNTLAQGADAESQWIHRRRPAGYEGGALHDELQVIRCAGCADSIAGQTGDVNAGPAFVSSLARALLVKARPTRSAMRSVRQAQEPSPRPSGGRNMKECIQAGRVRAVFCRRARHRWRRMARRRPP